VSDMNPCPVAGCTRRHSRDFMMCRNDWFRVSKSTRDEVYEIFWSEGVFSQEYRDVRAKAIAEAEASRERALAK